MNALSDSGDIPTKELPVDVPFSVLADGELSTVSASAPFDGLSSEFYASVAKLAAAFAKQLESQGYERVELAEGAAGSCRVLVHVDGRPRACVDIWPREMALDEALGRSAGCWRERDLPEGVEIFVISNGAQTRYCSRSAFEQLAGGGAKYVSAVEHTDWWADANGVPICDLMPFAKTFFAKHALRRLLGKYCVADGAGGWRIMRPGEILETEGACAR